MIKTVQIGSNVRNATILRAQLTLERGSWGSLDILAAPSCNRVGKMPSKEDKVSIFTSPLWLCCFYTDHLLHQAMVYFLDISHTHYFDDSTRYVYVHSCFRVMDSTTLFLWQ